MAFRLLRKKNKKPEHSPCGNAGEYGVVCPEPVKCSFWTLKNRDGGDECKNCGEEVTGKYCSNCGQKKNTRRFVFSVILNNFLNAVFNVERGIFKTALMLFSRPGYMSRDYIEGKRVSYTNPFSLMVLLAGIYSILYLVMMWDVSGGPTVGEAVANENSIGEVIAAFGDDGTDLGEMSMDDPHNETYSVNDIRTMLLESDMSELFGGRTPSKWEKAFVGIIRWLVDSVVVLSLFLVPIFSLFIKMFFWRVNRARYNYTELMYVSAYMAAQRYIIDLLMLPIRWIFMEGNIDDVLHYLCLGGTYFFFTVLTLRQLFGTGWVGTIFRTLGIFFLSLLFTVTLLLLALGMVYWLSTGGNMFAE